MIQPPLRKERGFSLPVILPRRSMTFRPLDTADLGAVLTRLAGEGERIGVVYVRGYWGNVNALMDLAQARDAV